MEDLIASLPLVVLPNPLGLVSCDGFSMKGIGGDRMERAVDLSGVRLGLSPGPSNLTINILCASTLVSVTGPGTAWEWGISASGGGGSRTTSSLGGVPSDSRRSYDPRTNVRHTHYRTVCATVCNFTIKVCIHNYLDDTPKSYGRLSHCPTVCAMV